MKPKRCPVKNERGSTIVAALLILVLLTIIGIAAINSSTTERATSANYLLYERVFFAAEAGLEHATAALQNQILARTAPGTEPKFSFALTGATVSFPTNPTDAEWRDLSNFPPTNIGKTYFASVNPPLEGKYEYSIYIWDNMDDADPTVDSDGTIFMLAQAEGPKNSKRSIFIELEAALNSLALSGYNAQEGAGSGKGFSSLDKGGINFSTATTQVGRGGGLALH